METRQERALIVASVASMIQQFNMSNIALLQELGYRVDVAANFETGNTCTGEQIGKLQRDLENMGVTWHQIDFDRNVMNFKADIAAYRQVLQLIRDRKYDMLHCHSPIGGVVGRLAGHRCGIKTIYTAHGFHFYQGAPGKNWLLYYPVEKFLSRYTDRLIVINREDYALAGERFHMKELCYVPGIGINTHREMLGEAERKRKRDELGIPEQAFMITSVAEFTANKNQVTVIKAIEGLENPDIYYVMCGIGERKEELEKYVQEMGLEKNIRFAGFREDIHEILQASDCFVLSSLREGLSVALMEAMAEGLPIVCGRIRGNVDLVQDSVGGYLVMPTAIGDYQEAFTRLFDKRNVNPEEIAKMGQANMEKIKGFDCDTVDEMMRRVYANMC